MKIIADNSRNLKLQIKLHKLYRTYVYTICTTRNVGANVTLSTVRADCISDGVCSSIETLHEV